MKIRKGKKSDLPSILNLIKELAHYERALDKVLITLNDLEKDGFGKHPLFWVLVAENENKIVGMAFYYIRYSTWSGKMFYLEDFVVKTAHRRKGVGQLLFDAFIETSKHQHCKLIKWQVLDWNQSAIDFYIKQDVHENKANYS